MTGGVEQEKRLINDVRALLDRQAIVDCLYRYCRGVDRLDRALLLSAYHPDAIDDHGLVVLGPEAFADWVVELQRESRVSHRHCLTNISIELERDTAHSESYFTVFSETRVKPNVITSGRYIDRLERRDGIWAIAARVCMTDSVYSLDNSPMAPDFERLLRSNGTALRSEDDISYMRPLKVRLPSR
jgi:hypothetical protein